MKCLVVLLVLVSPSLGFIWPFVPKATPDRNYNLFDFIAWINGFKPMFGFEHYNRLDFGRIGESQHKFGFRLGPKLKPWYYDAEDENSLHLPVHTSVIPVVQPKKPKMYFSEKQVYRQRTPHQRYYRHKKPSQNAYSNLV